MGAFVLDAAERPATSWRGRYRALRLNTVRAMSDLPGRRWGRHEADGFPTREQVVRYLERYEAHHRLDVRRPRFVCAIERDDGAWVVRLADDTTSRVDGVVVCTGRDGVAHVPAWAGRAEFAGTLLHSSEYVDATGWVGRRAVVVGLGSSAGEIALDLCRSGVDVTVSARTGRHVLPRRVAGVATTPFGPVLDHLPCPIGDAVGQLSQRVLHGGTGDVLPPPAAGMATLLDRGVEPMTADGFVAAVRDGQVRVVGATTGLDEGGVVTADGRHVPADLVVAATGYRTRLDELLGELVHLDEAGRTTSPLPSGLAVVGQRVTFGGALWSIDGQARAVARRFADELGGAGTST